MNPRAFVLIEQKEARNISPAYLNGGFFPIAAGLVTRIRKYQPLCPCGEEITINHFHETMVQEL